MAYIEFNNIRKIYKTGEVEIAALNKASFSVEKGELVCILGPSGAGKTTALNILGGMDSATSGKLIVDGLNITELKGKDLIKYRRSDIGFVFQFYNLVQNLTALENVELAVQLCKDHLDPKKILKRVGLDKRMNIFLHNFLVENNNVLRLLERLLKTLSFYCAMSLQEHLTIKQVNKYLNY